ncbi:MAG: squalene/phytoene synthase family protein [Alphaproteobacteria bacterium]|nr:squalene/phytoene synthase family protein [Alphaproteobacteria bacterium]
MTAPDALSYCAAEVRRHDPDRYLCAMFAPADRREDLFALYTFNLEIARTREQVSERMLGQIRLQWWREAIEGIYTGAPRRHVVVTALAAAATRRGIDRAGLERIVDAREADLDDGPPVDLAALEAYAGATAGELAVLASDLLGAGEAAREPARLVGTAWALAGLLRAVGFHARNKRTYLPGALLATHGARLGDLYELRPSAGLSAAGRDVADRARQLLRAARSRRGGVPRAALPVLLQARLADACLARLRRRGFDVLAADAADRPPMAAWGVALAWLAGRY